MPELVDVTHPRDLRLWDAVDEGLLVQVIHWDVQGWHIEFGKVSAYPDPANPDREHGADIILTYPPSLICKWSESTGEPFHLRVARGVGIPQEPCGV